MSTDSQDKRPKSFYTKSELEEFRVILDSKMKEAKEEIARLQLRLRESNENQADTNINDYGSESTDKEQNEMFLSRQVRFLDQLERALIRIENGTYGKCKVTGKLISRERLRVVPHTESSMEAKNKQ